MRSIKQKLLWERKYANIRAALWHPVIPAKAGIQFWFLHGTPGLFQKHSGFPLSRERRWATLWT